MYFVSSKKEIISFTPLTKTYFSSVAWNHEPSFYLHPGVVGGDLALRWRLGYISIVGKSLVEHCFTEYNSYLQTENSIFISLWSVVYAH